MGHPGTEAQIPGFAAGAEGACFADSSDPALSAYAAYGAAQDDLFIIDRQGLIQHHFSTLTTPLSDPANRAQVDSWVRTLF